MSQTPAIYTPGGVLASPIAGTKSIRGRYVVDHANQWVIVSRQTGPNEHQLYLNEIITDQSFDVFACVLLTFAGLSPAGGLMAVDLHP